MIKKLSILLGLAILSAFVLSAFLKEEVSLGKKINGIALEAPSRPIESDYFKSFSPIGANWICLMPYAYSPHHSSDIIFNENEGQWWGERKDGTEACIEMSHNSNLEVMLKPHLWIGHGQFTGDVGFEDQEEWQNWEDNYRSYILAYAEIAEKHKVSLFCIGTELKTFVLERPDFWFKLIREVRAIYKGKLTYAGNWDSYKDVPFWSKLDYIGVDAYFPLSEQKDPSLEVLKEAWHPWIKEMESLSLSVDKPIVFTEFGYCSVDYSCKEPWKQDTKQPINEALQQRAYEAMFETVWNESFFLGGYIWKWHVPDHFDKKRMEKRFSPQEKLAEKTLKEWYSKNP